MVRHTTGSGDWGPFTDDLQGTDDEGPQGSGLDNYSWTVPWDSEMVEEFLFATGDCAHWLIATPTAVGGPLTGEYYSNDKRDILMSSTNDDSYTAKWYNRAAKDEDPWISLSNHGTEDVLYGESSSSRWVDLKNAHSGANVYIRSATTATGVEQMFSG